MSKPNRATQGKRNRERANQEKQEEKRADRARRKEEKDTRARLSGEGEDPDLAGIVPGPQPREWD